METFSKGDAMAATATTQVTLDNNPHAGRSPTPAEIQQLEDRFNIIRRIFKNGAMPIERTLKELEFITKGYGPTEMRETEGCRCGGDCTNCRD